MSADLAPAFTSPTDPGPRTVECPDCGAHVPPRLRGKRPSPHNERRVRRATDGTTEVYETDVPCVGADVGQGRARARRGNAMPAARQAQILRRDGAG